MQIVIIVKKYNNNFINKFMKLKFSIMNYFIVIPLCYISINNLILFLNIDSIKNIDLIIFKII